MKARGCGMVNFFEHPSSTRWNGLRAHILRVYDLRELSFFFLRANVPRPSIPLFFLFPICSPEGVNESTNGERRCERSTKRVGERTTRFRFFELSSRVLFSRMQSR